MVTKTVSTTVPRKKSPYKSYSIEATIDFTVAAYTLAQNDILEALVIPAKTFVERVIAEVLTVEGAARNYAIGDGVTTNGYITTTTANTLGITAQALTLTEAAPNTVTGFTNGKYYSAADTIDILAVTSGGLTTGKIRVTAFCRDLS